MRRLRDEKNGLDLLCEIKEYIIWLCFLGGCVGYVFYLVSKEYSVKGGMEFLKSLVLFIGYGW